ncbi:MAG: hypothetical protein Kow006_17640 [Gammaproteobacteria bacterium]
MSTLDQLRDGFGRALYSLAEGWRNLRQRAANALTHFTPTKSGEVETRADQLAASASRWGVLAAEISEDDHNVVVRLEVPGLEPEDFDLQIVDTYLVVRGEKRVQNEQVLDRFHIRECAYGRFERALELPAEVDESRTSARYRNGVLTVTLPKLHRARRNKITVHVES